MSVKSSKDQPVTPWGAFVMFWLLIAAIVAAASPWPSGRESRFSYPGSAI